VGGCGRVDGGAGEDGVEGGGEADVAGAGACQRRVDVDRDRVVVALRPGGGHRAAVEVGLTVRVRRQRGERRGAAKCAAEGPGSTRVDGEAERAVERTGEVDVAPARAA